jgi:hypothetical protein
MERFLVRQRYSARDLPRGERWRRSTSLQRAVCSASRTSELTTTGCHWSLRRGRAPTGRRPLTTGQSWRYVPEDGAVGRRIKPALTRSRSDVESRRRCPATPTTRPAGRSRGAVSRYGSAPLHYREHHVYRRKWPRAERPSGARPTPRMQSHAWADAAPSRCSSRLHPHLRRTAQSARMKCGAAERFFLKTGLRAAPTFKSGPSARGAVGAARIITRLGRLKSHPPEG